MHTVIVPVNKVQPFFYAQAAAAPVKLTTGGEWRIDATLKNSRPLSIYILNSTHHWNEITPGSFISVANAIQANSIVTKPLQLGQRVHGAQRRVHEWFG